MIKLIASFFRIGYLPLMSGTYASLVGLLIFYIFGENPFSVRIITAVIIMLGFITCGKAEIEFNEKDSSKIVIDEVSGMLICCCFVPYNLIYALTAFLFFRIFDIFKPFPINKVQNFKGSLGIMLDDILAAFYVVLLYYLFYMF